MGPILSRMSPVWKGKFGEMTLENAIWVVFLTPLYFVIAYLLWRIHCVFASEFARQERERRMLELEWAERIKARRKREKAEQGSLF